MSARAVATFVERVQWRAKGQRATPPPSDGDERSLILQRDWTPSTRSSAGSPVGSGCRRRLKTRPPRQIGWVISVEDWALIRRLVADGVPRRQVARQLRIGRATVDRAVASDRPPKYERKPMPTAFTPFETRVRAILAEHPEMPATLIAERVGWSGSITWFGDNVRTLRPDYRRPDPADRLVWNQVTPRSVIYGSRRSGSRWKTGPRPCCRCWSSSRRTRGSSPAG